MRTTNRGLLVALVVLVVLVLAVPVFGGVVMGPGMMGPGMMGGYGYGGLGQAPGASGWIWGLSRALGGLAMLAFWGALIVGVVLLVRWLVEATTASSGSESSLDILQRRYAAGEITREEYQQMRQVLER